MMHNYSSLQSLHTDDTIDMTNLSDLTLLLCACLLVALPVYPTIMTQLAKQDQVTGMSSADEVPIVEFSAEESLRWNGAKIDWAELQGRLKNIKAQRESPVVALAGDQGATYGFSIRLRSAIVAEGITVRELTESTKEK